MDTMRTGPVRSCCSERGYGTWYNLGVTPAETGSQRTDFHRGLYSALAKAFRFEKRRQVLGCEPGEDEISMWASDLEKQKVSRCPSIRLHLYDTLLGFARLVNQGLSSGQSPYMTCNSGLSRLAAWERSVPSSEPATQTPAVFALPCDLCVRARKLVVGKNLARLGNAKAG